MLGVLLAAWGGMGLSLKAEPADRSDAAAFRRKLDVLKQIAEEATASRDPKERGKLLRELLAKSSEAVQLDASCLEAWVLRGTAAVELNLPHESWEAGKALVGLGVADSEDRPARRVLARINRRGWLTRSDPGPEMEREKAKQEAEAKAAAEQAERQKFAKWVAKWVPSTYSDLHDSMLKREGAIEIAFDASNHLTATGRISVETTEFGIKGRIRKISGSITRMINTDEGLFLEGDFSGTRTEKGNAPMRASFKRVKLSFLGEEDGKTKIGCHPMEVEYRLQNAFFIPLEKQ